MAYSTGGTIRKAAENRITVESENSILAVEALEPWLLRVSWLPAESSALQTSWMIDPRDHPPAEGRKKSDLSPFSCPPFAGSGDTFEIFSWRVSITTEPKLGIALETLNRDGLYAPACADRASGAYWPSNDGTVTHYQAHDDEHRIYGLGDKTGPLNKANRRYRFLQLDALGYDPDEGDPLYKHIPVFLHRTADGVWYGEIYDSLSEMTADLGLERSNYHGRYRSVKIAEGTVDRYLIAGPTPDDVVKRITLLSGRPALMPRWSLGLALTSMHHMDAADPGAEMVDCIDAIRDAGIPFSAYHLASGYQLHDGRRYFFVWDRTRIPDPKGFIRKALDRGVHVSANIKPVILVSHPAWKECAEKGLFIKGPDGNPIVEIFWGEDGSFLDFTAPGTADWWQGELTRAIYQTGIESAWNDNNEHEIFAEDAVIANFGDPAPSFCARPLHALLMDKASHDAALASEPDKRPFGVTRAGPLGIQRYCQTWTGDNLTDWRTLHGDLRQVLGLALSGVSNTGFDIGGFAGQSPGPEILIRWFQLMAMMPRCFVNGWNLDEVVTTPVMHPEAIPAIRAAMRLRYRLLPTLYSAHVIAHETGLPHIRPLFYDGDDRLLDDGSAFFAAEHLISAPALFEGQTDRPVTLPASKTGWVSLCDGTSISGGGTINVPCRPDDPLPLFARAGSALLLAQSDGRPSHNDPDRIILVPTSDSTGSVVTTLHRDDGISRPETGAPRQTLTVRVDMSADSLDIALSAEGDCPAPDGGFLLVLPHEDPRPLSLTLSGLSDHDVTIERSPVPTTVLDIPPGE